MDIADQKKNVNRGIALLGVEGYFLKSLDNIEPVFDIRETFQKHLKIKVSREATLETYHKFIVDDEEQIKIHYELSQLYWAGQWHLEIFKKNKAFFEKIVGPDLDVQAMPHLRLARPGMPQDNIGYHRDIDYGGTAYEIGCVFPLTTLNTLGALQLIPGSHSITEVKVTSVKNEEVERGSIKNQLGVPYLWQTLADNSLKSKLIPIPMKIGEALCFCLGVIHGQEVNGASDTRWSIDLRIKNSFVQSGCRSDFFNNLYNSPATKAGITHYKNNPQAK